MTNDPVYTKVGSLDYADSYGSLIPVYNCSVCGSLATNQETHTKWHRTNYDQ